MLKSQLVISLAAYLLLSPGGSQARFLEYPSTSLTQDDGTTRVISSQNPTLEQPTVAFNANLNCGECVVGGYVYCVNGVEGFTGTIPQRGVCCQNSRTCPQINTRGWICSNKYDNMTLVDKLRVCPFDMAQCGSQSLNFNDLGDSQCLRLRTLKKGSTCLYRVQSKCGVPRFQVNDTSADIFTSSVLITNKTVDRTPVDKCSQIRNQNCICREFSLNGTTRYSCDCESVLNIELAPRECSTCRRLTDTLGNVLQQCTCALPFPVQAQEDQLCTCDRVTNAATRNTSLSCVCPRPTSRVVSFTEDRCKCLNNYNSATRKAFLDCTCRDTDICPEPASLIPTPPRPAPAPCSITYPCNCSATRSPQNVIGNATAPSDLQCTCANPSTQLSSVVPALPRANCSCQVRINSNANSWFQECNCCLAEQTVRTQLIAPIQCTDGANKQSCACRNQTVTVNRVTSFQQICNCTNPTSSVVAPNLVFNNNGCDCENTAIGNKSCTCCVELQVQAAQLQPRCDSQLDSCSCTFNQTTGRQTCNCDSRKFNFTFNQVSPAARDCYCAPLAANQTQRVCNCCVSDNLYQQVRQTCPRGREASPCRCENVPATNTTNASFSCNCTNRFFFNQTTPRIVLSPQSCACFNRNGVFSDCSCCATENELVAAPATCGASQVFASCNRCANVTDPRTRRSTYTCNCVGAHPQNSNLTVNAPIVAVNTSSCGCVNLNGRATCDCCVSPQVFATSRPICPSDTTTSERCSCQTQNVTEQGQRVVTEAINTTLTFVCRRTGFNGELCLNNTVNDVTAWTNAFACYTSAAARCEYQISTKQCGWTMTPALTNCLARPARVANPRIFQNLTFAPAAPQNVADIFNVSRIQTFNFITSRFACNCSNSRVPQFPLNNIFNQSHTCGCDAPVVTRTSAIPTQTCDCCVNRKFADTRFIDALVCRPDQLTSSCTFERTSNFAVCNPQGLPNVQYQNMRVDLRNCACLNTTNTTQNCKCCLPSVTTQLIPAAPTCSFGQNSFNGCKCEPVGRTANLRCDCPTGNITRVETFNETIRGANNVSTNVTRTRTISEPTFLTQSVPLNSCNCLTTNNNRSISQLCNCCLFNTLTCAAPQFADVQSCECRNVTVGRTWQWSCNCLRRDNNVRGQFTFTNQSLCNFNPDLGETQCCVTRAQVDSQVPVLNCNANTQVRQGCTCTNATRNGDRNCECRRPDNGILGRFNLSDNNCLCNASLANSTNANCNCCVAQSLVDTQIPRKSCVTEGPTFAPENCQCVNNRAPATGLNCTCARSEFQLPRVFNLNATQCLNQGGSRFECCLNTTQRETLIPRLECNAAQIPQTGCRCRNVTMNGRVEQICDCSITYQRVNYTLPNLTSQINGCMCNSTACGCCLTQSMIETATERVCRSNETRSVCQSCQAITDSRTRRTTLSCSGCNTFPTDSSVVIIRAQAYQNLQENNCMCRNETSRTNCTCCQPSSQVPLMAAAPTCANGNLLMSNTRCEFSENNATMTRCNITRREGAIETYFTNVNQTDLAGCNCFTITNGSQTFRQCQCCVSPLRLSPAQPNCTGVVEPSTEQCNCLPVRGPGGVARLNCDCNFRGIQIIRDLNLNDSQCGCLQTNTLARPCQCCVSVNNLRDRVAPSTCESGNPIALCDSTNITFVDPRTRAVNSILRGNCSAFVNGINITNNNITLDSSRCGCFNDSQGRLQCRCCMSGAQNIRQPVQRQCRADQLSSNCECSGNSSCSCTVFSSPFSYSFPTSRPNSSDCNCVLFTQGNTTTSQCSCCQPRTVLTVTAPVCDASNNTIQQCNCRSVFNRTANSTSQVCDCTRTVSGRVENRNNVDLRADRQCSCLNQNLNGINTLNCTCCVPNPPPSLCQRLSAPRSNSLGCVCRDIIVDGKATPSCNCTQRINATSSISRAGLVLDETNDCCCTEVVDPRTRIGSRVCNCTIPTVPQNQNCQCRAFANNTSQIECQCNDCNNVRSERLIAQNRCQCRGQVNQFNNRQPGINTTNSTTNTTRPANGTTNSTGPAPFGVDCSCQVDYFGLCPVIDFTRARVVDEGICEASNRPRIPVPSVPSNQCNNEYEYLVAVVAANKDSSVLVNVQSLQGNSGYYFGVSIFAFVILALTQLF